MSPTRSSEAGFTLAGLIVLMTVMAVFIAYTVPRQWSLVVARDRDRQTYFAMKQYARAIRAFQEKHKTAPVSLDQIKEAKNPRFLRGNGELIDPLTGKVDWIVIPAGSPQQATGQPTPGAPPADSGVLLGYRGRPATPPPPQTAPQQPGQPGGFVGPIIGVRPNKTGESYILVNGMDTYEQWSYTTLDLEQEINQRRNAVMVK